MGVDDGSRVDVEGVDDGFVVGVVLGLVESHRGVVVERLDEVGVNQFGGVLVDDLEYEFGLVAL